MSELRAFPLPDLGEGLPDATVVEWFVKPGGVAQLDQPLVAMETAKAVVEVPAPCSGTLVRIGGGPGEVITTGALLAEFEIDPALPQRSAAHATGHHGSVAAKADAGSVVGAVGSSDQVRQEAAVSIGGVKAVPAVRALAKKLGVDLARTAASGSDGNVTLADVRAAAEAQTAEPAVHSEFAPAPVATGVAQNIIGVRRNMARVMGEAQMQVALTTICDDAELGVWGQDEQADITARCLRALVRACAIEPSLNAWFDAQALTRTLHAQVDVGVAVDTQDGLFVPVLRDAGPLSLPALRAGIDRLAQAVRSRRITPAELSGYTISLSNFGAFAGRYATPVVLPPCVAILALGRARHQLQPAAQGVRTIRALPLSVSFDHRAVTGGEASRFLRAVMEDLVRDG